MENKNIINTKFSLLLGFTALTIALCAAFFSVYGIGSLFAGAAISAMVMAGSLELGKLIATTFLYRYWNKTGGLIKTYLTIAVISLMIITSAGIFGFLSAAYQKSSLMFKLNQDKISAIEQSKGYYTNQIVISEERIRVLNESRKIQEARLSEALTNTFLSRNPIQLQQIQQQTIKLIDQANEDIKTENVKIENSRSKMQSIDEKVNELKIGATEKKDIQTFKFLADALQTDLDTVAKWFIISLIFVFDPLAIALILAYNVVIYKKEDEKSNLLTESSKPIVRNTVEFEKVNIQNPSFEIISTIEPKQNIPTVLTGSFKPDDDLEKISEPIVKDDNTETSPQPISQNNIIENKDIKEDVKEDVNQSNTIQNNIPQNSLISSQMSDYYKRMFKK